MAGFSPFNEKVFYGNLGLPRERVARIANSIRAPLDFVENHLWIENIGRSDKDSPVGAMGVAQMMPTTFRNLKKAYPDAGLKDPRNPEDSLKAYELLMKENLARTNGNLIKAAQAYHGGWDPKRYGPENRKYVGHLSNFTGGPAVAPNPTKQQQMINAYQGGIGNAPSVGQVAMEQPAAITPIEYTPRDFWEEFQRQDPLQGARNYALNPITFESLAGYGRI